MLLIHVLEVLLATTSSLSELSRGLPQLVDQLQTTFTQHTHEINNALASITSATPINAESPAPPTSKQSVASMKTEVLVATSELHTLRLALANLKVHSLIIPTLQLT